MPPHDHHPHHHHHHRHALRISGGGFDRAVEVLTAIVGSRVARIVVDQGSDGPPEPVSLFYAAIAQTAELTKLVSASGKDGLTGFAEGLIDPDARGGELSIGSGAAEGLKRTFAKDDANKIERALSDGPGEMRAVAIVQALNLRLLCTLADQMERPKQDA